MGRQRPGTRRRSGKPRPATTSSAPPVPFARDARADPAPSGETFRLLVDAVMDYAIFLIDTRGYVRTWNRGAARIKGYRADEIIGQHFSRFYTPEDLAANRPMRLLDRAARHGRVEDEGWRVRKDGTRFWADVILSALRGPDGEPYAFAKVIRDLTERRAAEESQRQLLVEQEARSAAEEALRARDRFLSIASHELRTPVATLQLAAEALMHAKRTGTLDDERLDRSLQRMLNSTRRLGALVNELLNVSRLESDSVELTLARTDLTEVVGEVVARFHDAGESRVSFEAAPGITVMADASRLDQVITNLIDNALKYSDRRSKVLVSLVEGPDDVTFTVTDSGIGLDLGDERLFNAFGRGENVGHVPGIGLGLFIARHIVDLHGGRISVTRRTDATGTTATVVLPFRDAEE